MTLRALLLATLLAAGGVLAEADRAYRRGDHAAAAAGYARALAAGDSSAAVRYNLGTALLRLGRHDEARPHLEAAAADPALGARAAYNAGHTDLAPVAAGRVPADRRVEHLERAVAAYRRALLRNADDEDAKWNLELAERLLREERRGGGGRGDDEDDSGGGGEGDDDAPAAPEPSPGASGDRPVSAAEAERILAAAERRDLEVQRARLRRDQNRIHGVRDW